MPSRLTVYRSNPLPGIGRAYAVLAPPSAEATPMTEYVILIPGDNAEVRYGGASGQDEDERKQVVFSAIKERIRSRRPSSGNIEIEMEEQEGGLAGGVELEGNYDPEYLEELAKTAKSVQLGQLMKDMAEILKKQ